MTLSNIVGFIPKQELNVEYTFRGERFYSVSMDIKGTSVKAIISEYIWKDDYFGFVNISCYLTRLSSDTYKSIWLRVVSISAAEEGSQLTNEFIITGTLTKKSDCEVTTSGLEIMRMTVSVPVHCTYKKVGITMVAKDVVARYYRDIRVGSDITEVRGYLVPYHNYHVIVMKNQLHKKEE